MANINMIKGDFSATDANYVIVVAQFNDYIATGLLQGALQTFKKHGVKDSNVSIVQVPGAFELPITVAKIARSVNVDAIITLGAVIKGETPHFDYISQECTRGLNQVSLETGIPVTFGVLTTNTVEQAISRAGGKSGNKGSDATIAAMEMVSILRKIPDYFDSSD